MATNDYPLGPCPTCCSPGGEPCACGTMWKGYYVRPAQCEGTRIDVDCVKLFCAEIIFDYSGLPGGGLPPSTDTCPNPASVLPSSYKMPLICATTNGTTGTPYLMEHFPDGPPGTINKFFISFTEGQPTGSTYGAYNSFHAYIQVEGGMWELSSFQNSPGHVSPFRIISCDPLLIEGKIVPGSSEYITYPNVYRNFQQPDKYASEVTPCTLGVIGGSMASQTWFMPATVTATVRITERSTDCQLGPVFNAKVAYWWCTPAGCVQAVDQPADSTAGPFNSRNDCMAGCGTAVALKWYCTPTGCVKVETPPANATSGPHDTLEICQAACQPTPPTPDPFWCVSGTCVQSADQPPGSTGPFSTMAECAAGCSPPPMAKWWCIYGVLVKMDDGSSPHPDAAGPYDDATSANCGPAEMVWHCAESGPARTSRWEAVQRGWQYWATEQEVIDSGCVLQWYCLQEGCGSFTSQPAGAISGPHATEAECQAACDNGPTAGWYCIGTSSSESARGIVSYSCQYFDSYPPMGTIIVSGPHENTMICGMNCSGGGVPEAPPVRTSPMLSRVTLPCIHLGKQLEDPATCGCGTAVLMECAVHGQCRRTGYPKAGEAICLTCPSYQPPESAPQATIG